MPASAMADKIISSLSGALGSDGSKFTASKKSDGEKAIAKAITDYIKSNTKINVSYVGLLPSGTPDPVVADVCEVDGKIEPIVMGSGSTFDDWIKKVKEGITKGFTIKQGIAGVSPLSPTKAFERGTISLTQGAIKSVHEGNMKNPQKAVWTKICEGILMWLNTSGPLQTPIPAQNTKSQSKGSPGMSVIKITVI